MIFLHIKLTTLSQKNWIGKFQLFILFFTFPWLLQVVFSYIAIRQHQSEWKRNTIVEFFNLKHLHVFAFIDIQLPRYYSWFIEIKENIILKQVKILEKLLLFETCLCSQYSDHVMFSLISSSNITEIVKLLRNWKFYKKIQDGKILFTYKLL